MAPTPSIETPPEQCDTWKNFEDEQLETLRKVYNEIVHWISIFFTISKNKVGFKIAEVMNLILTRTFEYGRQNECTTFCTMKMSFLFLARSKSENEVSLTKTLTRRSDLWIRCNLDDLFVEATSLQDHLCSKSTTRCKLRAQRFQPSNLCLQWQRRTCSNKRCQTNCR